MPLTDEKMWATGRISPLVQVGKIGGAVRMVSTCIFGG